MKRKSKAVVVGMVAFAASAATSSAQWTALPSVPEARSRAAGAMVGGTYYFMGGETTGGARPVTCWKIDLPGGAWTPITAMPGNGIGLGGVSNVDASAIGTDIYLPGGWQGTLTTNPLLRYDTVGDAWTLVATDPVPSPIHAHSVTAHQGKLYVFGGATASGVLATVGYIYDPAAGPGTRWSPTAMLPVGRQYPSAVALSGKVYVAGGIGATTAVEYNSVSIYDIATNTWSAGATMAAARGGPAMFIRDNNPYIVAGGWATYLTSGEALNGAWAASDPCMFGVRTIAHDSGSGFLAKAGGWSGAYSAVAEYYELDSCYPDCTGEGTLTVADFGCFQGKYVLGDMYADCSGDGLLAVGDFGCFQGKYVLGCP